MATESVSVFHWSSNASVVTHAATNKAGEEPKTKTRGNAPLAPFKNARDPRAGSSRLKTRPKPQPACHRVRRGSRGPTRARRTAPTLTTSTSSTRAVASGLEPIQRGHCRRGQIRQPSYCCLHCHRCPRGIPGGSAVWPGLMASANYTYTWQQHCHKLCRCTC